MTSGGGQEEHYIYANDFGGTGANIPVYPVSNDFTKVVLNFKVTNNQVTLGFYAKGNRQGIGLTMTQCDN